MKKLNAGIDLLYASIAEYMLSKSKRSLMLGSLTMNEKNNLIIFHESRPGERDFTKFIDLKNGLFRDHFNYTLYDIIVMWCKKNNFDQNDLHVKILKNEVFNILNFGKLSYKKVSRNQAMLKRIISKARDKIRKTLDVELPLLYKEDIEKAFNIKLDSDADSYIVMMCTPFGVVSDSQIKLRLGSELEPVILDEELNYAHNEELATFVSGVNRDYNSEYVIRYLVPETILKDSQAVKKFLNSYLPRIKDFKGDKIRWYLNKVTDDVSVEDLEKAKSIIIRESVKNRYNLRGSIVNGYPQAPANIVRSMGWLNKMNMNTILINYKNKIKRVKLRGYSDGQRDYIHTI